MDFFPPEKDKFMDIKIALEKIIYACVILLFTFIIVSLVFNSVSIPIKLLCSLIISFFICIIFFSRDMLNPFILLLISTGLGTADIIVVSLGLREIKFSVDEKYYIQSLLVVVVWHLTFFFGYMIASFKMKTSNQKKEHEISNEKNYFNEKLVFFITLGVFIFGAYLVYKVSMGYGGIIHAMQNRKEAYKNLGFLSLLLGLGGILPVLLLRKNKKKTAFIMLLAVFILNAALGGRTGAIYSAFLPTMIYYNYNVNKFKKRDIILFSVPIALFAIFWGQLRMYNSIQISSNFVDYIITLTKGKNYGQNLPYLIYSIDTGIVSYQFLRFAPNIIFSLIPRAIWSNKPSVDEAGIIGRLLYGDSSTGQPIGPYGFAYICFGWVGVLFFGFLTGFIVSRVKTFVKKENRYEFWLWYSYISVYLYGIWQTSPQLDIIMHTLWFVLLMVLSEIFKNKKPIVRRGT